MSNIIKMRTNIVDNFSRYLKLTKHMLEQYKETQDDMFALSMGFNCYQTIELYLKSIRVINGEEYMTTHNLNALIKDAEEFIDYSIPKSITENKSIISKWYIDSRYGKSYFAVITLIEEIVKDLTSEEVKIRQQYKERKDREGVTNLFG